MKEANPGRPGSPDPRWAILLTGSTEGESSAMPDVPGASGSSIYTTDIARVRTQDELVDLIASVFAVPHRIVGLDAVLSVLSDLEWAPNSTGYLWVIRGLATLRVKNHTVFCQLVSVLVYLCDRWRSGGIAFRILVLGDEGTLQEVKVVIAEEFQGLGDSPYPWVDFKEPAVIEMTDGRWKPVIL